MERKWPREEPEKIDHLYNFAVEAPTFMGKKSQMHFKCMWKSRGQHRNAGEEPKVDGSDWI